MEKSASVTDIVSNSLRADAEAANEWEHSLTLRRALRLYSTAFFWAVIASVLFIMEGYDTKLLGSLYAQPVFQKAYGVLQPNGSYEISAAWQSGLNGISGVTSILGISIGGYVSERFGFRVTMMTGLLAIPAPIFAFFFAPRLEILVIGQVLLGIALGLFQTIATVYVFEIMPTCLRCYLTSTVTFVWALGQLLCAVVLRGTLTMSSTWAYRIPFAVQWFWPVVLIVPIYLAPESPWWLVRQNRLEEAEAVVSRLTSEDIDIDIKKLVAFMVFTTEHERSVESSTTYRACFRGTNLRRTIIVCGIYWMQVLTGGNLRGYMTYFFQQAGLSTDQSFNMSIVGYGLSMIGVIGAWIVMTFAGRRTMQLWGTGLSMVIFFAIGGMGVKLRELNSSAGLSWTIGSLLLVDSLIANTLVVPVIFPLASEIPSSILRSKTAVLARNSYTVINIVAGTVTPYMLNPSAWGWGAITGFFWGGACVLCFLFTYFMVPEPKGKTTAEMDILFETKVPIRKFKDTKVDISQIDDPNGLP